MSVLCDVEVMRVGFTGELAWELHMPVEYLADGLRAT